MRRVPLVAVMIALVSAVLAVSLWMMVRADRAALRELRSEQGRLAQDTASALHGFLDSLDRDTRLLTALASRTRRPGVDRASQDAILDAFQALAIVVPHYRTIALYHPGAAPVIAIDPTEEKTRVVPGLISESQALAAVAVRTGRPARAGPLTLGPGRSFYLFAAPTGADEAVVTTTDAAVMLETVSRRPAGADGVVFVDPTGAAWIGCEHQDRCRLVPAGSDDSRGLIAALDAGPKDGPTVTRPGRQRLGLPGRVIVGDAFKVESPLGTWSVAVVAPATDHGVKQDGVLWQLVITSAGVVAAMLAVGILILRQHANAAELRARLRAAEEVARLQRQLVRAEKLVTAGVLSAGIAHEIGTPLAVVRGRAELLLERRGNGRDADDLRDVVSEIDNITAKIQQVLDFSREQPARVGKTDAHAAVKRALTLLEWRLARKQVHVEIDARPELPPLAATADQFDQVLVNLLLNACDASDAGGTVRIVIAPEAARTDCLRIEVSDSGNGIPAHHINAVFDPYFTTKKRGEGTGLGLAIVSQIVRRHRGEISLRSTVGVGTVATLTWPLASTVELERKQVA